MGFMKSGLAQWPSGSL